MTGTQTEKRLTDRQTDSQSDWHRPAESNRQMDYDRQTGRQARKHTGTQRKDIEIDRDKQKVRRRPVDSQTDRI